MREIKKGGIAAVILATEQASAVMLGRDAGAQKEFEAPEVAWSTSLADRTRRRRHGGRARCMTSRCW
jgi:hypothetical protein